MIRLLQRRPVAVGAAVVLCLVGAVGIPLPGTEVAVDHVFVLDLSRSAGGAPDVLVEAAGAIVRGTPV
ncbi:MAG: hypothetical protein CMJ83_05500, partial [Planctomycetes bacterium]|nr:hypothetical protein [Planctomycetota bacterium]